MTNKPDRLWNLLNVTKTNKNISDHWVKSNYDNNVALTAKSLNYEWMISFMPQQSLTDDIFH